MPRWLQELKDFAGFFLLPLLCAILPSRLGTALATSIAHRPWFYDVEARQSLSSACRYVSVRDEAQWLYKYRLIRFCDDVDLYLWMIRGDAWMRRNVQVHGVWPETRSFVAITFHWGGGIWALRSMRQAGITIAGLAVSLERSMYPGALVRYWYAWLRTRETARIIGGGLNFTGNASRRLVEALRSGVSICGLFDVPARAGEKTVAGVLFGAAARYPRGLPRIAVIEDKPIVVFFAAANPETGKRKIWIDPSARFDSQTRLAEHLSARLQAAIEIQPEAWHHWTALEGLLVAESANYPPDESGPRQAAE